MWFAWALLIFSLGAAVATLSPAPGRAKRRTRVSSELSALGDCARHRCYRICAPMQWPVGKEVWGLQPGYFASYVVLFVVGCVAASPRWLERLPDRQVRTGRRVAWIALPVLPIVVLLGSGLLGIQGQPDGGWSIPALICALWEPFVAWG